VLKLPSLPGYRRATIYPPAGVTLRADDEQPAGRAGLAAKDVEAIWKAVVGFYRLGLHPALSLCLKVRGVTVLRRSIGYARGAGPGDTGPEVLATPDTPFNLFSATKPVTGMLIMHLVERGDLDLDLPVAHYLPGFERHGKGRITVRHVLCHRAGMPAMPGGKIDLAKLHDRAHIVEQLCEVVPEYPAGEVSAYHAVSGGFILAEIVERITGQPLRALCQRVLADPLGCRRFNYGLRPDQLAQAPDVVYTGPPSLPALDNILKKVIGAGSRTIPELCNEAVYRTATVASANLYASPEEVCLFYEMLRLGGRHGERQIFEPRSVAQAIAPQADWSRDRVLQIPMRYGLGFMLGGKFLSFYGFDSPKAFGHLGYSNILAWCDPERELVCCLMNNGKPFVSLEMLAWLRIVSTITQRIQRTP
jgi:CubicO group peptidase (beta-lactamase class C family)